MLFLRFLTLWVVLSILPALIRLSILALLFRSIAPNLPFVAFELIVALALFVRVVIVAFCIHTPLEPVIVPLFVKFVIEEEVFPLRLIACPTLVDVSMPALVKVV